MARFLTLSDANVSGKTVLVRADLNVPMADGQVSDGTRLDRLVPTLELLTQRGAKVAVLSHFGRPKGKVVPEMSLEPVAAALADVLGASVQFAPDCVGSEARAALDFLPQALKSDGTSARARIPRAPRYYGTTVIMPIP